MIVGLNVRKLTLLGENYIMIEHENHLKLCGRKATRNKFLLPNLY